MQRFQISEVGWEILECAIQNLKTKTLSSEAIHKRHKQLPIKSGVGSLPRAPNNCARQGAKSYR